MDSEAPAVITGVYADYKRIPSRKSFQVIVEVPIEQAPLVHAAFGEPNPDGAIWVAVALLNPEHAKLKQAFKDSVEVEKKGGRLARQAGMVCNEPSFWRFLTIAQVISDGHSIAITNADEAKRYVYDYCGVESRRDLDHNDSAASNWKGLESEYQAWKQM